MAVNFNVDILRQVLSFFSIRYHFIHDLCYKHLRGTHECCKCLLFTGKNPLDEYFISVVRGHEGI